MNSSDRPLLRGPGLLFLVVAGFALLYPLLKYWPGGHPMSAQRQPDACALARQTASAFSSPPETWTVGEGASDERKATCRLQWPAAPGADPPAALDLIVFTQASLSAQGSTTKTDKWFALNASELRASTGSEPEALGGTGKQALLFTGRNARISLLVEDGGAGFLIHAHRMPSGPLRAWALSLRSAMRANKS